jgi:PTS system fructose-specific IIC component
MNVLRFLRPECIQLPLTTLPQPLPEDPEVETAAQVARRRAREKEAVIEELAAIFARCDQVVNQRKLHKDLIQRESNATTAIAPGIAIPHLRTLQARSLIMGLATAANDGLHYGSLDGQPTRLFVLIAAPPYDDRLYHQVHKAWAELLLDEDLVRDLTEADSQQAVFNRLRVFFR